jgi:flavodoxin
MKSLVIYDSNRGNTQKVAETIATELGSRAINILSINPSELTNLDLLVVGTPIIGWRPTVGMQEFLSRLQGGQLKGVKATAFDTRVKLFIHGDAMGKVASSLKGVGADIFINPTPFYVEGPQANPHLLKGELEKAKQWSQDIKAKL